MTVHLAVAGADVALADRVSETTQTIGTGSYALDGVSVAGYRSFVAGVGNGVQTIYTCVLDTTWEIGVGTVSSGAPDTISRTYILATSAGAGPGGAAINWPTTAVKTIFIDTVAALLLQIQAPGEVLWAGTAGGTANARTISVDPRVTALRNGMVVWFQNGAAANSGNMTLAVNGIGPKSFLKAIGTQIPAGEAAASAVLGAVYLSAIDDWIVVSGLTRYVVSAAQTAAGGETVFDFDVKSDAVRITIMFRTVDVSGADDLLVQVGTASAFIATGYEADTAFLDESTNEINSASSTAGFIVAGAANGGNVTGHLVLTKLSGNIWVSSHYGAARGLGLDAVIGGGSINAGAAVTRVRATRTGGTFTAGTSLSVLAE